MSRDPKRISRVLELLKAHWSQNTDLRLGQLVANLAEGDPFYIEDDELEKRLRKALKGRKT